MANILICGGGIGGLTAALSLLSHGHQVQVFEQAEQLEPVGAGIQISPNAMKVMIALKLSEAIEAVAFAPEAIETRMGKSGRQIFSIPIKTYATKKWGAPYLNIHRADYIKILQETLDRQAPNALHFGMRVQSVSQTCDGVHINLSNGQSAFGDILIAADGIHSDIAKDIDRTEPIFTRNTAWRAVIPVQALGKKRPPPTVCAWLGDKRHAVTYYIHDGNLVNFVGVVERDIWEKESWITRGKKLELLTDFSGWHESISAILEACDPDQLYRWGLFEHPPKAKWVDRRIALLGDSAHSMLPFLAQGAAMAVEDAWILAKALSHPSHSIKTSLQVYQNARLARTKRVQRASMSNMRIFHQSSGLGQITTYGPMWLAMQVIPKIIPQRMNWLYGYDVTRQD